MFKNTQSKIILIIFIAGILIIGALGISFLASIESVTNNLNSIQDANELANYLQTIETRTKYSIAIVSIVFTLIAIIIATYLSKFVILPLYLRLQQF